MRVLPHIPRVESVAPPILETLNMSLRLWSLAPAAAACLVAAHLALPAPAADSVQFVLKVSPEPRLTETVTIANQTLKLAGMEIPTNSTNKVRMRSTLLGQDTPRRVEQKTESLQSHLELPGGLKVEFDSADPGAASASPAVQSFVGLFRALSSARYVQVLDERGRVTAVEGLEELARQIPADAQELAQGNLNPDVVKTADNQQFDWMPEKAVTPGESWSRTELMPIGGGQTFTFETFYEYVGPEQKGGRTLHRVKIHYGSVKYAFDAPNAPVSVASSDLNLESSRGHLLFDLAAGLVVERQMASRIRGGLVLSIMGTELPGDLDLTLETRVRHVE
jgi:hypothetical protein